MAPGKKGRLTTGRLLRVPLPITGNVARRLIEQIQRASTQLKSEPSGGGKHSVLILEFDPGSSEFGLGRHQNSRLSTSIDQGPCPACGHGL